MRPSIWSQLIAPYHALYSLIPYLSFSAIEKYFQRQKIRDSFGESVPQSKGTFFKFINMPAPSNYILLIKCVCIYYCIRRNHKSSSFRKLTGK